MYAIRSYYESRACRNGQRPIEIPLGVITSYSIHYTKLYDLEGAAAPGGPRGGAVRWAALARVIADLLHPNGISIGHCPLRQALDLMQ